MKIGLLSIWFERGQTIVTKTLRDCLLPEHQVYIFARMGGVYGIPKQEKEDTLNVTFYPSYQVKHEDFSAWILKNKLDMVIFNEEYDWGLVLTARNCNVIVATYLDFYTDKWKAYMYLFDLVICSTKRTFNMVKNICKAKYIGWGIDTEIFKPVFDNRKYTFFHNAGWLGINYRKQTPIAIFAFNEANKINKSISLFIHSQCSRDLLPEETNKIIDSNKNITYFIDTIPAPGMYYKGNILLFPSKLEGLGLPLLEGLSCGLPAIICDAPPMNEFVQDGYNGYYVPVSSYETRNDNVAFPETLLDIEKFIKALLAFENIADMSYNARQSILDNFNIKNLSKRILKIIKEDI